MNVAILDDYQDAVRGLDCFRLLDGHHVAVWIDHEDDVDTLAERLAEADAIVLLRGRTPMTAALLSRLPRLKLISQSGHTDHIDLAACGQRGVVVSAITATRPSYATAELTWGLILAALRHIPQEAQALRDGRWQSTLGQGLRGHVLGVFGYGRIGALVAGYGRAFGMEVLVWGRDSTKAKAAADGFAVASDRASFFAASDVVSLHVRYSASSRHLVTAEDFACMKPTALFVNTSRAELVEPGALVAALGRGRPGRAAVDVFEREPFPDDPLIGCANALCTPHLGYVERDSHEFAFGNAFEQVAAYAAGTPIHVVSGTAAAASSLPDGASR